MKRKVLFLIESLAGGGAEKVLTTLVQHIDKEKFDVTVCAISGGGKYENDIKQAVKYHSILESPELCRGMNKLWYLIKHHLIYQWLPMSWVYRLFVPKGNDVEIAFVEGFATKLMAASCNKHAKKIAWVHCDLLHNHWTRKIYCKNAEEICYSRFNSVITMSKTQQESLSQLFSLHTIKVCYNPVDTDAIQKLSSEKIQHFEKQSLCLRIVSIGRFTEVKAYDRLLRVIHRLKTEDRRCELWLLGDGTDRNKLEAYISENNLSDDVTLWGFQSNPYKYLRQCDLFVCSSISEGFSTAVTEALILGLPVVSTEVSGIREQLTNGCGIITENNEEALYLGIRQVIDHPEQLVQMRQKALERGKDFSLSRLMSEIEAVLQN